jgi:hypothetical protein
MSNLMRQIVPAAQNLAFVILLLLSVRPGWPQSVPPATPASGPVPLLAPSHSVDWWFVFKFNGANFPGCAGTANRACPFGGSVQKYESFGQQFVYASSENEALQDGAGCLGDTTTDPVGATFDEVYNDSFYYVVWNDQLYDSPKIQGCTTQCGAPWGHSKGLLAWNADGSGLVMQVSTPSWPASGSSAHPRSGDGNTLGCIADDDIQVSQHFFALKLTKDDVVKVLTALNNASVVTDPKNPQLIQNGGPADIQQLVSTLGKRSASHAYQAVTLSSGVELISKPSKLLVPPWQMVSAILGGTSLRAATWWTTPEIYSTTAGTAVSCWDPSLGKPGGVEIATTGQWEGKTLGLTGGPDTNFNHAKIGVSTSGTNSYSIFGDMNQQGTLSGPACDSSQNGRGGLFYVLKEEQFSKSLTQLLTGGAAPAQAPVKAAAPKKP